MSSARIAGLAITLCAVSASIAGAQSRPEQGRPEQGRPEQGPPGEAHPGGMRRGGMMGNMSLLSGITLSDTQKAQVKAIREKYAPQMIEIRMNVEATGMAPDSSTRARMMGILTAQNLEIRAILTADQQQLFDKNTAEMKARMETRAR